ncbi:MAG: type II toxin-antitoxin system VapC family toxin [Gemmatimonadota bacterium]
MEGRLILETTFLIDLERERGRGEEGPAHVFLEVHAGQRLFITFTVAGELAAGKSLGNREAWSDFLAPFHILSATREVCWRYGATFRHLQANGMLIGTNDLWIAATALANAMPVVTKNAEHFRRVPGVEIADYFPS